MKIAFLLDNAYGIGGTIRSTVNLSRALSDRHSVEVVSLRRTVQEPALPFDPRVTMTTLLDLRGHSPRYDGDDPLFHRPSERFAESADALERGIATRLGDLRIAEYLRDTDADVVVATRPKINDYLAAYGESRYLRIGQEHLTRAMHRADIRAHQDAAIPRLDAFLTVSYADAAKYRAAIPGAVAAPDEDDGGNVVISCIPNAVPDVEVEPSDGQSKLIVAAGRLIKVKRYDRLLSAFALVAEKHPDWRLRLYGRGRLQAPLRAKIESLGLYDRAFLMGARSPIETEWAKGAIAAVSSNAESFGMTLVEAMRCGVPVVSTDCPYGPGEIITNGRDGLLSPLGDKEGTTVRAYADALLHLIESPELRHRMSQAALRRAERYAPRRIAEEYEQLITRLDERRRTGRRAPAAPPPDRTASRPTPRADAEPKAEASAKPQVVHRPQGDAPGGPPAGATAKPGPEPGTGARPRTEIGSGVAEAEIPAPPAKVTFGPPPFRRVLRRHTLRVLRPVLGPLVRRLRGRRQGQPAVVQLRRPVGRVRATSDGSLVFRLHVDRLPQGRAALLFRARRDDAAASLRLVLPPRTEAVDGWVEVRLDRAVHRLPESRWDTYVERAVDGRRKRVRAQLVETARLLSMPAPHDPDGALAPWVPYATTDGHLALRTWRRTGHAEVVSVDLGPRSCTVQAQLYGTAARAAAGEAGTVVAVPRNKEEQAFELSTWPSPAAGPPAAPHASLSFDLPYDLPALRPSDEAEEVWDLWYRPGAEGAQPVRFARLLGDLADRKKTDVLPWVRTGEGDTGLRWYFSLSNNLALTRRPLSDDEQAQGPVPAPAPVEQRPAQGASSRASAGTT